jgi:hypothetical protein
MMGEDDVVFPEWMFNVCVEDVKEEKNVMLLDVMADRIVKAEKELKEIKEDLHTQKLQSYYPSFREFRIGTGLHGAQCEECGEPVVRTDMSGQTVVSCPRCNVSVKVTTSWYDYMLAKNKRLTLTIR